jgi:hypothetical protein
MIENNNIPIEKFQEIISDIENCSNKKAATVKVNIIIIAFIIIILKRFVNCLQL